MSITDRVWIERDPTHEDVRAKWRADFLDHAKGFSYRLPAMRFKRGKDGKRERNPWWASALSRAIEETSFETVQINGGVFFRTKAERDRVRELAEHYATHMPLELRARAQQRPHEEYLAARFTAMLRGPNTTVEKEREKAKRLGRDCPECGYPMKQRVARKGPNAGSKFLGCCLYPSCSGTKRLQG